MTKESILNTVEKMRPLNEEDVRSYLMLNPDFFDLNLDLLALLKPSREKRQDGIVDFQSILLDRLQHEVKGLTDVQSSLIFASRSNMTTQMRIHSAVLSLFEAEDFDHLCHIVCNDWVDILKVDSIIICFEKDAKNTVQENINIRLLEPGMINDFIGPETAAILRGNLHAAEEIYGPATPLIKAEALIRMEESRHHPLGILAFGSRDEEFFTPGQGTELLQFLSNAFQGQLNRILSSLKHKAHS